MIRGLLVALAATVVIFGGSAAMSVDTASAHRHGCHRWHACPSDHATYRWRGLLCVAPYSPKYNRTFRRKVVYAGRTYWCKR
jgi:hypothetical protein